jgi:hypothetical protein
MSTAEKRAWFFSRFNREVHFHAIADYGYSADICLGIDDRSDCR